MKVDLATGIAMNVETAGPADAPPVIFVHGFPESHRTWRGLVPLLSDAVRMVMPDQRGFGATDKPQDVADYATETLIADLYALADALGLDRFALVGHDWGGAIAWAAALRESSSSVGGRIARLGIVNSPHPAIFQKSLVDDPAQRAASQYMNLFRNPAMEMGIAAMGLDKFFAKSFAPHVDLAIISAAERKAYLDDWSQDGALTSMLNWYRASQMVVPQIGEAATVPEWAARGVPRLSIPVRVVWGLEDRALLPIQLEGIGEVGDDVSVFPLPGVGHFAPWEAPDKVAAALRPFLTAA